MVQKVCPDCNSVFEYQPNPKYADKRKYCDDCGAVRKAQYEQSQAVPQPVQPKPTPKPNPIRGELVETQIHIIKKEAQNSYEFGRAGNRFKLYFDSKDDLQAQIDSLVSLRLPPELTGESNLLLQ